MSARGDKLKKLEAELRDLEQWLKLGLVPKKDMEKHETEIKSLRQKIDEEQDRLRFLKESGDLEEYVTPRRQPTRTQYTEMPSLPDIDVTEEAGSAAPVTAETAESEADSLFEGGATSEERTEEETVVEEYSEEEDPFSDRNRWRRGMLQSDDDEW